MTDLRKAAEMALEFVAWFASDDHSIRPKHKAPEIAEALRQALAEPEQVLTARTVITGREWVGLTNEEVESWRGNYDFFNSALVREVEAKLKEKNGF